MNRINIKECIATVLESKITGGKAEGLTLNDIAKKHKVDITHLKKEFLMGKGVEMEHATDPQIAQQIALDHLYEMPNYYTKLKKMEQPNESYVKFSQFCIIGESALEDLSVVEDDDEHNIEVLHEIEYKIHQIINNRWGIHPKLFKNIIRRFSMIAIEAYSSLEPKFTKTFDWWKEAHEISSADAFANMIWNEIEENGMEDETNKYGVSRGRFKVTPKEAKGHITKEMIKDMISQEYYPMDVWEWALPSFVYDLGVEIPEDDIEEYEKTSFARNYIEDNNLEDEFANYLANTYDWEALFGEIALSPKVWKNAIKTQLYPEYVAEFGAAVENVRDEIAEHEERVAQIDTDRIVSMIEDEFDHIPTDDDSIEDVAKQIYDNGIAPMLRTISLAMNIDHVNGNISRDYGDYGGIQVDPSFYDGFHKRNVADWDRELKSIIRNK